MRSAAHRLNALLTAFAALFLLCSCADPAAAAMPPLSGHGGLTRSHPVTPPAVGASAPLRLDVNLPVANWFVQSPPLVDAAFSAPGNIAGEYGGFVGTTTSNPIPDANRDASGNVKSLPSGEAAVAFVDQFPATTAPRKLTWSCTGTPPCTGSLTVSNASSVSVDQTNRFATYTPNSVLGLGATGEVYFSYTPVSTSNYPITFVDRPVTDPGGVTSALFNSVVAADTSAPRIFRFMDYTSVNRLNSPIHQTATAGKTISSITFSGTTATVTTSPAHGLIGIGTASQSASVTVSGVTPSTYNVTDAFVKVISPTQFQYTMGGTPAGNATVVGSYTVGDAGYQSTNLHYPSVGSEPGTQFNEPIYTSSNRNKNKTDAEWHDGVTTETLASIANGASANAWYTAPPNADSTFYADVAPVWATFAAANNRDVYVEVGNEPWNSGFPWFHQLRNEGNLRGTLGDALTACRLITTSNVALSGLSAIDGFTPIAGDRILVTGQSTASQNGVYVAAAGAWSRAGDTLAFRDIWFVNTGLTGANTSWFVSTTGAITAGTTPITIAQIGNVHRYAEKVIEVANPFITAFASAGASSHLHIVASWQNYGSTAIWSAMQSFLPSSDWAKITDLSVAPYYGDDSQMGIAANYTGSTATLKAAISADITATISHAAGHLVAAQALGKRLIFYEGGSTVVLTDSTYGPAFARSSDAYDLELQYLQQLELQVASKQTGGLDLTSYNLTFPLGGAQGFAWGQVEYLSQTLSKATTPKLWAHVDFKAGVRVLSAATGALGSIDPAAAVGTPVVTLGASAYGVVWSLSNSDGNRLAINAATGQVTVAAGMAGTAGGSRSITARQTLGALTNDTVEAYNVGVATTFDPAHLDGSVTLTNANLTATKTGAGDTITRSTVAKSAGYAEFTAVTINAGTTSVGVTGGSQPTNDALGLAADSAGWLSDGRVFQNSTLVATWSTWTAGDKVEISWKGGKFYGRKNGGAWEGGADASAGTGGIAVSTTNAYAAVNVNSASTSITGNFGGSAFAHTAPTGTTNWQFIIFACGAPWKRTRRRTQGQRRGTGTRRSRSTCSSALRVRRDKRHVEAPELRDMRFWRKFGLIVKAEQPIAVGMQGVAQIPKLRVVGNVRVDRRLDA
jgi:hypothetical protein